MTDLGESIEGQRGSRVIGSLHQFVIPVDECADGHNDQKSNPRAITARG